LATSGRRALTQPTRARSRRARYAALVLGALALVLGVRLTGETAPPLRPRVVLPGYVRIPGSAPVLAWPREGEAAVTLQAAVGADVSPAAQAPVPIASVAKVMTAYVTLLEHPLGASGPGFTLRVTQADVAEESRREELDQSVVPVRANELISERQALQALLLPSANNIAWLLAAHEGGVGPFLARMNATARRLGMNATAYTDPSGFEATTMSTAVDQLKLARVAMATPAFAALVDEHSAGLPVAGRVLNYNALVGHDGYVGVKTGSDAAAGGCLMFAKRIVRAGRPLMVLGVVLGQRGGPLVEAALTSAARLGDSAAAAVHMQTALAGGTRVLEASANDGRRTSARTAAALRAPGWPGLGLRLSISVSPPGSHVHSGERMGTVTLDASGRASTAALASRAVGGPSLGWRLSHLF
jgi:D-alanyl-D-alanine carboxypeptidase (penicillin-binding protein 5/6)